MLGGWSAIDTLITDDGLEEKAQIELRSRLNELILA